MSTKKTKKYLPPEILRAEYELSKTKGEPTVKLISYFELIATKLSNLYDNTSPKDRASIIAYATQEAWRKWETYDERNSTNIFSFFTTVIFNDLRTHYNSIFEKDKMKRHNVKKISIESLFSGENV